MSRKDDKYHVEQEDCPGFFKMLLYSIVTCAGFYALTIILFTLPGA